MCCVITVSFSGMLPWDTFPVDAVKSLLEIDEKQESEDQDPVHYSRMIRRVLDVIDA